MKTQKQFVILTFLIFIFFSCEKDQLIFTNEDIIIANQNDTIFVEATVPNYFPLKIGNNWEYEHINYGYWFNDYDGTENGGLPLGPVEDTFTTILKYEIAGDTLINNKSYFIKKMQYAAELLRNENNKIFLHFYNSITQTHHEFQLMNSLDSVGMLWVSDTLKYTYNNESANLWFQSEYIEHFDSLEISDIQYYNVKRLKYYIGISVDSVPSWGSLCSDFTDLYVAENIGPIYQEVDECVGLNTYSSFSTYTINNYSVN